jgi:hypothetical protein
MIVMHKTLRAAMTAVVLLGASLPAAAQSTPWEDRVFANLSFGVQAGSAETSRNGTFVVYDETGSVQSTAEFGSFAILDVAVGARVFGNFGVGLAYHDGGTSGSGTVTGTAPHPLFFGQPRNFSETFEDAQRDEQATHLQLGYMLPLGDSLDVFVYGGPSWFRVSQQMVTSATFIEQGPPYTNITVLPAVETVKTNATGYNIGADATYILYTTESLRLGVGGFMRYTGANAELDVNGARVETDMGGFQIGFGARVRF